MLPNADGTVARVRGAQPFNGFAFGDPVVFKPQGELPEGTTEVSGRILDSEGREACVKTVDAATFATDGWRFTPKAPGHYSVVFTARTPTGDVLLADEYHDRAQNNQIGQGPVPLGHARLLRGQVPRGRPRAGGLLLRYAALGLGQAGRRTLLRPCLGLQRPSAAHLAGTRPLLVFWTTVEQPEPLDPRLLEALAGRMVEDWEGRQAAAEGFLLKSQVLHAAELPEAPADWPRASGVFSPRTDVRPIQPAAGAAMWQGDSIEFAFDFEGRGATQNRLEFIAALPASGPELFKTANADVSGDLPTAWTKRFTRVVASTR